MNTLSTPESPASTTQALTINTEPAAAIEAVVVQPSQPLDQNPAAVYLASLRVTGRRSMHHYLNVIAGLVQPGANALSLPWSQLRYQHTAAIRSALIERGYKPATVNTALKALRRVLGEARKLGQLGGDDYSAAISFSSVKGETLLKGRALSGGELGALMSVCAGDASPAGARDAALVAIAYGTGLRRSELVKLDLSDYNSETGGILVRGGKGGKDRQSYVGQSGGAVAALADWLLVRGSQPGALFCPITINKGKRLQQGQHLSDQAVLKIFKKRGSEAGVQAFSPHDMRRSFISDLLDAGADIATAQKLAGHANVQTTAKYDRRGEVVKKKAVGLLHIPYSNSARRTKLG